MKINGPLTQNKLESKTYPNVHITYRFNDENNYKKAWDTYFTSLGMQPSYGGGYSPPPGWETIIIKRYEVEVLSL
jgi:hypothetical protein